MRNLLYLLHFTGSIYCNGQRSDCDVQQLRLSVARIPNQREVPVKQWQCQGEMKLFFFFNLFIYIYKNFPGIPLSRKMGACPTVKGMVATCWLTWAKERQQLMGQSWCVRELRDLSRPLPSSRARGLAGTREAEAPTGQNPVVLQHF